MAHGAAPALTFRDGTFIKNGTEHQVLAGSMHYFRVHPEQWRDRLQRLVDMGLNTVDTYVAWNFHQPREHEAPDFSGWRDIEAFVRTAAEAGLDVIVRPSPYICAEWTNGGLPAWLTRKELTLRSSDPAFMAAVASWYDELLPRLVPLQASHGGPIIAMQVENEFGSYGDDRDYVRLVRELMLERGIVELLYTADGANDSALDAGTVDGTMAAVNLGSQADSARALTTRRRNGEPFLAAEYWNGWFDHWGYPHHTRGAESAAHTLASIIKDGGNVSIFMAHGGTNFGTWAGANFVDGEVRPTTTSYDSDAPIAEDGRLTDKFFAYREVLGATAPIVSTAPRITAAQTLEVEHGASLPEAIAALEGATFPTGPTAAQESFDLDRALVRYEAKVRLPDGDTPIVFEGVDDRALVFIDGAFAASVRTSGSVVARGTGRESTITVLIENLGRVNIGSQVGRRKGLTAPVTIDRRMIQSWTLTEMKVEDAGAAAALAAIAGESVDTRGAGSIASAGVARARFTSDPGADAHLALPDFVKGFVWVNGFLLGRYWEAGPQETYYVPAPLLRPEGNEVVILELERRGTRIELREQAELGPEEEYTGPL